MSGFFEEMLKNTCGAWISQDEQIVGFEYNLHCAHARVLCESDSMEVLKTEIWLENESLPTWNTWATT